MFQDPFKHQSIPAVPMPPPPDQPPGISIFWKKWANSRGWGHMSSLNALGWGRRKRANARPPRSSPSNTSAVFISIGEFVVLWNLLQSHLTTKKSGGFRRIYYIIKLRWDCGGCPTAARVDRRLYSRTLLFLWRIDPLNKWRLNLNNNTWYILSLALMFQDKRIFTWMWG